MFNSAYLYGKDYLSGDLSRIKQLTPGMRSQTVKALSHLSKFLGTNDSFSKLLKNNGLTWVGRSGDDIIIDRLSKTNDADNIFHWIINVKDLAPRYSVFLDFIAVTGLRFSEAIHSYNLIVKLNREQAITEKYYDVRTGLLEHFRFKETFIRDNKKAFVSYVPLELLDLIGKQEPINPNHLKNKVIGAHHFPMRFSDVRENHASFVTKWLRPEEIDWFHGRASSSVFSKNYYNIKLVSDLKIRAAQAAQAILLKVNSDLILEKTPSPGGED